MNFEQIGPLQMLIIGFDKEAEYEGLILDELERLSARGLIRVIDLQFVLKEESGALLGLELSELSDEEAVEYGAVIGGLIGLGDAGAEAGAEATVLASAEQSYGLSPMDIQSISDELEPGEAVGLLLFEHSWAARLKQAIRETGGYPIAQGFLTPEALMMVGREVEAVMEAEVAIEVAEAVKGAALLDALTTIEAAEQIKTVAAAEAARALIVAGLIEEAAAEEAIDALIAAELIESAAIQSAEAVVAAADAEAAEASVAVNTALDEAGI
jgi:uncharacterized membrane protein